MGVTLFEPATSFALFQINVSKARRGADIIAEPEYLNQFSAGQGEKEDWQP